MGQSSTWGLGALAPFPACVGAAILAAVLLLTAAAPAWAHDGEDATDVVSTLEEDPDGEGWIEVSRHLDPFEEFSSDRRRQTAAVAGSGDSGGAATGRALSQSCTAVNRATDDASNNYHSAQSRVIKVIYAYPTDVGNRIGTYAPVIQTGVRWLAELAAGESGNRRALRFDIGTTSGAGCVDIQVVPLTLPASAYTALPSQTFTLLRTELLPRVTGQPGSRNFLVYADGVNVSGVGGEAQVRTDDSASGAQHGLGNLWAMVYGRGGSDFFGSSAQYAPGTTSRTHVDIALHEVSHTLGAVQRSVPHPSAAFHCLDEYDVLCYDDDGSGGRATYVACNTPGAQYWDCNKDDYFNATPGSGSYLATHWNLFNSVFMCPAADCAPGGVSGPPDFAVAGQAVAPETKITKGPGRKTKDRTPTFRFNSNEAGAKFNCSVDGSGWQPCVSPRTLRKLTLGRHRFSVYASGDSGGRWDDSPEAMTFKVIGKPRRR
jgi:hypothetical protein